MSESNKNIIWIASYPKSGNTWLRIFICNLFSDSQNPFELNGLSKIPIATNRRIFDTLLGVNSADLTEEEIDIYRPLVYNELSSKSDELVFLKVHDAWRLNANGDPIFPEKVTKGVIYIVRNPFEIAVSLAFHSGITINKAIENMNSDLYVISKNGHRLEGQLTQLLFSWSKHVNTWTQESNLPLLLVRYEDLVINPYLTFQKVAKFIGKDSTELQIRKAIRYSDFSTLKEQEENFGFQEKNIKSTSFFRSGKIDTWKKYLNKSQLSKIYSVHSSTMQKFGYGQEQNKLIH